MYASIIDVQQEQKAARSFELSHAHHSDGWANLHRYIHGVRPAHESCAC